MIYDCFTFFNELDILKIRLNALDNNVDRFVLVESPYTHSGKPKPLYYKEVSGTADFESFRDKIVHVIWDDAPDDDRWVNENAQRNAIMQGLPLLSADDIVLVSDADEIPNPKAMSSVVAALGPGHLEQKLYYYFLNCRAVGCSWTHAAFCRGPLPMTPQELRMGRFDIQIANGGWHYSYLGEPETMAGKITSFAHQEYDSQYFTDIHRIDRCMVERRDIYDRDVYTFAVEPLDGPDYLLRNKHLFRSHIAVAPGISQPDRARARNAVRVKGRYGVEELACLTELADQCGTILQLGDDPQVTQALAGKDASVYVLTGNGDSRHGNAREASASPRAMIDRGRFSFSGISEPIYLDLSFDEGVRVLEKTDFKADMVYVDKPERATVQEYRPLLSRNGIVYTFDFLLGPSGGDIEQRYSQLCLSASDINEHLPVLRSLAEECRHVTEFGMRYGKSTVAFLAARPKTMVSYDINDCSLIADALKKLVPESRYTFRQGDVLNVDIEPTELLFIDTFHAYSQLICELLTHADKAGKYIVLHDVETFGKRGEDGHEPGLSQAITDFLERDNKWDVKEIYRNNNGLCVLTRRR